MAFAAFAAFFAVSAVRFPVPVPLSLPVPALFLAAWAGAFSVSFSISFTLTIRVPLLFAAAAVRVGRGQHFLPCGPGGAAAGSSVHAGGDGASAAVSPVLRVYEAFDWPADVVCVARLRLAGKELSIHLGLGQEVW